MSLPSQEAIALENTWKFLLALSSGEYKVTSIKALRQEASLLVKHYPLAAGPRWRELRHEEDANLVDYGEDAAQRLLERVRDWVEGETPERSVELVSGDSGEAWGYHYAREDVAGLLGKDDQRGR